MRFNTFQTPGLVSIPHAKLMQSYLESAFGKEFKGEAEMVAVSKLAIFDESHFRIDTLCGVDGLAIRVRYVPFDMSITAKTSSSRLVLYAAKEEILQYLCEKNDKVLLDCFGDDDVVANMVRTYPDICKNTLHFALESTNTNDVISGIILGKMCNMDTSPVYSNAMAIKSQGVQWALYGYSLKIISRYRAH